MWPLFVYSFLNVVQEYFVHDSGPFFNAFKDYFAEEHADDLRALSSISLPDHIEMSDVAKIYMGSKYRLSMSSISYGNLIQFLERKEKQGGSVVLYIMQTHMNIVPIERAADDTGLARLLRKSNVTGDFPAEDEGIPGHNAGSANTDRHDASTILTKLKLGPLPFEPELLEDVEAELAEEDQKNPPGEMQITFVEEFKRMIKREESEESPNRADTPMPPSRMRDVVMEVQKVKENRDRFNIEGRTGGVGPAVSVCMFTFHNTYDK